jgi:hypothetical protein
MGNPARGREGFDAAVACCGKTRRSISGSPTPVLLEVPERYRRVGDHQPACARATASALEASLETQVDRLLRVSEQTLADEQMNV